MKYKNETVWNILGTLIKEIPWSGFFFIVFCGVAIYDRDFSQATFFLLLLKCLDDTFKPLKDNEN